MTAPLGSQVPRTLGRWGAIVAAVAVLGGCASGTVSVGMSAGYGVGYGYGYGYSGWVGDGWWAPPAAAPLPSGRPTPLPTRPLPAPGRPIAPPGPAAR
jgi:hypothetical protein